MLRQHSLARSGKAGFTLRRSLVAHVRCSFNFADSQRVKQQTQGRRNRQIEKRQEQELRNLVHGLCGFNNKQLQAVAHLLSDDHISQIKIAMDIPPTNQGRRRQEGLVAKLLRAELDTLALDKLSQAVSVAQRNNLPYSDTDVEQQLQLWIEGLVVNDQEIVDEVYSLLMEKKLDWQQFRTWVRQLQQHQQQQQQQQQPQQGVLSQQQQHQQHYDVPSTSSSTADPQAVAAAIDPEVQQLMLELAGQQQQPGRQGSGSGKKSKSAGAAARRAIRNMLKPLAVAMHAA